MVVRLLKLKQNCTSDTCRINIQHNIRCQVTERGIALILLLGLSIPYRVYNMTALLQEDDQQISALKSHMADVPALTSKFHQKCNTLDLTNYTHDRSSVRHDNITNNVDEAKCMDFTCTKDIDKCDNTFPTNYSASNALCCAHILRDMARIFDEEMCRIGLDYHTASGTLLGMARADCIIP